MKKLYILFLAFFIATVTSCTYTFPEPEVPTTGSADFTKVVAVGNSLTAGYMNGALYDAGQAASFANLVAQQISLNGGGSVFNQPDIDAKDGFSGRNMGQFPDLAIGWPLGRLHFVNPLNPAPQQLKTGQEITDYAGDRSALNNFGVPGMRIIHAAVSGYGVPNVGNPYFVRFASTPLATVLDDATAANGSFFLFWLGSNDALGYALAGATGLTDGTGSIDMTPVSVFEVAYIDAITKMTANGAKGIVANLPNVNDIPHFTTVPWNAIPMDQANADAANAGYIAFNGGINAYNAGLLPGQTDPPTVKRDTIGFKTGQNGIVMYDSTMADLNAYGIPTIRQAKSSDLITLTAGAVLGTLADPNNPATVIGVGVPLAEKFTLIQANQEAIATRIAEFNAIIKSVADGNSGSLAFLDFNTFFADFAQNGLIIHGAGMDTSIVPPFGAFSLDGVHPNARGAAYIASLFIDKINEVFGSNIPNLNPNNYPGNELPVP
ncbi:MAG: hypothetical protein DRI71_10575 [Bacteroidetes bacterium]|nr:MAG: hypothetical protein DRI71_10575 [Bacteroidota bacterium]